MELHFEPITSANRKQAEALDVLPEQNGYIESVKQCLTEADSRKSWRPVGIYDGGTLVGFAMYGFFWEYLPLGRVWLDRLLIDQKYQGRGYGKAAVLALLERIRQEYKHKKIYLSVYAENTAAIHLYKALGFQFNGQLDRLGEKVMVYQFPKKHEKKRERK